MVRNSSTLQLLKNPTALMGGECAMFVPVPIASLNGTDLHIVSVNGSEYQRSARKSRLVPREGGGRA
jgi:hypothetical protein